MEVEKAGRSGQAVHLYSSQTKSLTFSAPSNVAAVVKSMTSDACLGTQVRLSACVFPLGSFWFGGNLWALIQGWDFR